MPALLLPQTCQKILETERGGAFCSSPWKEKRAAGTGGISCHPYICLCVPACPKYAVVHCFCDSPSPPPICFCDSPSPPPIVIDSHLSVNSTDPAPCGPLVCVHAADTSSQTMCLARCAEEERYALHLTLVWPSTRGVLVAPPCVSLLLPPVAVIACWHARTPFPWMETRAAWTGEVP
jgi:hypothetical protein